MDMEQKELVALYLFLVRHEDQLDGLVEGVKKKLEKQLYTFMSVGDLQDLLEHGKKTTGVEMERKL